MRISTSMAQCYAFLICSFGLCGCSPPLSKAPEPVVVIDDSTMSSHYSSGSDAERYTRQFIAEMESAMMTSESCKGVGYVHYYRPLSEAAKQVTYFRPYWDWTLNFEYNKGLRQEWTMALFGSGSGGVEVTNFTQRRGTPEEVARDVCMIIRGLGARER